MKLKLTSSSLVCFLAIGLVDLTLSQNSTTSCPLISTCGCVGDNCTENAWLVGGSTLKTSDECEAWCSSDGICGGPAGFGYTCGVAADPKYADVFVCETPGKCTCNSDTCQDKAIPDAYTNVECELKCNAECGVSGVGFGCDGNGTVAPASEGTGTSEASSIRMVSAVAVALLLPALAVI